MHSDNQRIAKNTIYLYGRMIVTMLIGMWTSRLVLNALGFTDQGLYNVVGGFVGFLSILTGSISVSISRFITFEIGRKNTKGVIDAFRNALAVQLFLALIVLVVAETLGIWYINNKLILPENRLFAVHIVYQFSVLSFIINLFSVAPNALIISYERMGLFAIVAILSAISRLLIGFIISYTTLDRLILYSILQFVVFLGIRIFYQVYCKRNFKFLIYRPAISKDTFKPMFSFAGWNMIGSSAGILRSSGTSVLLNYFGGPIANTINGIANQVNSLATMFVNDFTTAFNPQITKKFASQEYKSLIIFLHRTSKYSYCLLLIMAIPVFLNIQELLTLWLKRIPDGTSIFAKLIIIFTAIECISRPLITAKNATGKIKNYQIVIGGILLLTIPLAYLFLKIGLPIWYTYLAMLLTSFGAFVARMMMLKGSIPGWSSYSFIMETGVKCLLVTLTGLIVPLLVHYAFPSQGWWCILQCIIGFLWCSCCVYFVACNSNERSKINKQLVKIKSKFIS